jgi:hypothetical protein
LQWVLATTLARLLTPSVSQDQRKCLLLRSQQARKVVCGVGDRNKAELTLRGAPATEETFRRAADAELADAQPLRDNAFKVPLARNVLVRTLLDLIGKEDQA